MGKENMNRNKQNMVSCRMPTMDTSAEGDLYSCLHSWKCQFAVIMGCCTVQKAVRLSWSALSA